MARPRQTRGRSWRLSASPSFPSALAETEDEAVAAAGELGFPVVLKTAQAGAHKTETGGVALRLVDETAVREAATRIGLPVLVQPMLESRTELLAGVVQDPTFGPLVAFGPGGVLAELIGEATFRIAPLTDADVDELVEHRQGRTARGGLPWARLPPTRPRSPTCSRACHGSARTCPK